MRWAYALTPKTLSFCSDPEKKKTKSDRNGIDGTVSRTEKNY